MRRAFRSLSDAFSDILDRDPGRQQRVRFGVAAGQRQHPGDVPEPGVRRNVPARCRAAARSGWATSSSTSSNTIRSTRRYASPTPTVSMPSMPARASYPFWREATGRPRRPSGPTGCRARTATASDSKDGPEVQKGGAAQRQREANLTTQASRPVYTCAVDATTGAPACVADALLSATPFNATTLNPANAGTQLAFNYPAAWTATDIRGRRYRQPDRLGPRHRQPRQRIGPRRHDDDTAYRSRRRAAFAPGRPQLWRFAAARGRVLRFQRRHASRGRRQADRHRRGQRAVGVRRPGNIGEVEPLARRVAEVDRAFESGGQREQQGLLPGRADRRLPGGRRRRSFTWRRVAAATSSTRFDVSDPDKPRFKFKLSPEHAGMSGLGQTWSMPKVTKVRDGTASGKVVLIFGGGYDIAEDSGTRRHDGTRRLRRGRADRNGAQAFPHGRGRDEHDLDQRAVGRDDRQRRPRCQGLYRPGVRGRPGGQRLADGSRRPHIDNQ